MGTKKGVFSLFFNKIYLIYFLSFLKFRLLLIGFPYDEFRLQVVVFPRISNVEQGFVSLNEV